MHTADMRCCQRSGWNLTSHFGSFVHRIILAPFRSFQSNCPAFSTHRLSFTARILPLSRPTSPVSRGPSRAINSSGICWKTSTRIPGCSSPNNRYRKVQHTGESQLVSQQAQRCRGIWWKLHGFTILIVSHAFFREILLDRAYLQSVRPDVPTSIPIARR